LIYDISLPENPALIKKIKLIKNFEPFCLTLYDHYLYTGGRWHGDNEKSTHFSAGFYNIKEKKPEWKSIPIPREYTARRKAVDDILIQSGSLYLLDNLVYPKYILTYTVMSDETLIPGEVIQLAANGPNEQIKNTPQQAAEYSLLGKVAKPSVLHYSIAFIPVAELRGIRLS
jgi:hypothetical protein